ncbi:hypothetical protein TeGR_g4391 [Tetraparma gracilis]|uniref:SRCR domain-containing protein n=1 Tax=Tetraparma gracilis TaxID=2962635 RepID=A0ABQ6MC43_9STRA|nr:hypothetical protein TeGR_g4391 [Tetraparma gracilis]
MHFWGTTVEVNAIPYKLSKGTNDDIYVVTDLGIGHACLSGSNALCNDDVRVPLGFSPSGVVPDTTGIRLQTAAGTPSFDSEGQVQGRLEVKVGDDWVTVASIYDSFGGSGSSGGAAESTVACRQLGNELGYTLVSASKVSYWDTDDGSGMAFKVTCAGTESTLDSCATFEFWSSSSWDHDYDVGVSCTYSTVGGYDPSGFGISAATTSGPGGEGLLMAGDLIYPFTISVGTYSWSDHPISIDDLLPDEAKQQSVFASQAISYRDHWLLEDYANDRILAFTHDFEFVTALEGGDLEDLWTFAIRPGSFAPASDFTANAENYKIVAGEELRLSLNINAYDGSSIPFLQARPQVDNYKMSVVGSLELPNLGETSVTVDGSVLVTYSPSSIVANATLFNAGDWTVDIWEEIGSADFRVSSRLDGSPFTLQVVPAQTEAAECVSQLVPAVWTAGEVQELTIETSDQYGNPTTSTTESYYYGFSPSTITNEFSRSDSSTNSVSFVAERTKAGSAKLYVAVQTSSGGPAEIPGSPFPFVVRATTIDPSETTSSLEDYADMVEDILKAEEAEETRVEIMPRDKFKNDATITGARFWFKAEDARTGESVGDIALIDVSSYVHEVLLPAGELTITIKKGFDWDSAEDISGSPYSIRVVDPSPPGKKGLAPA